MAHIRHLKKCTTFYTVSATKARGREQGRGARPNDQLRSETRALRQKAVRRSHRLRHDNWAIGSQCGRNAAPALPEATVSGQFVQIFGRKENPRGGDVLVKVRHR